MTQYYVYFEDQLAEAGAARQRLYTQPIEIITANCVDDIAPALAHMQKMHQEGLYLAGYFSYELGHVLEPVLDKLYQEGSAKPLLKFGVFKDFEHAGLTPTQNVYLGEGKPLWSLAQYQKRFAKVMAYIRAGDVYQINLSFPVYGDYVGDGASVYEHIKARQPVRYGGVISLGGDEIVSLSPELFFETEDRCLRMRPMKGTCARSTDSTIDMQLAKALQQDVKNRAENLMIVDLLRNDMSRLSVAGSVSVTDLFSIETFPTLHTMTSGIESTLEDGVDLVQILKALFPCGSITGAPKIRAQEIIQDLETQSRGAYCGAHGYIDPNGDMRFNVGIRTLILQADKCYVYNVGSAVVADSDGAAEYDECLLKSEFLQSPYQLIETFGWDYQIGFMHFDLHLARLCASAKKLGFKYDPICVTQALEDFVVNLDTPHKVRLTLDKNGDVMVSGEALNLLSAHEVWDVALSKNTVNRADPLLMHKTTRRGFLDGERRRLNTLTGCQEVLLFNTEGELCEGSFTNVFVEKKGTLFTPPISAGLLGGILRHVLLANKEAQECQLTYEDVITADALYIGNSVRGLIKVRLLDTGWL
ncbi:MAG: aminodeoxychorismate synthase, component I [Robiginitomaculum sp.]|nr:MAG: aminodeoxychorismate synthase, component I [Robiginitomaculum sp.]